MADKYQELFEDIPELQISMERVLLGKVIKVEEPVIKLKSIDFLIMKTPSIDMKEAILKLLSSSPLLMDAVACLFNTMEVHELTGDDVGVNFHFTIKNDKRFMCRLIKYYAYNRPMDKLLLPAYLEKKRDHFSSLLAQPPSIFPTSGTTQNWSVFRHQNGLLVHSSSSSSSSLLLPAAIVPVDDDDIEDEVQNEIPSSQSLVLLEQSSPDVLEAARTLIFMSHSTENSSKVEPQLEKSAKLAPKSRMKINYIAQKAAAKRPRPVVAAANNGKRTAKKSSLSAMAAENAERDTMSDEEIVEETTTGRMKAESVRMKMPQTDGKMTVMSAVLAGIMVMDANGTEALGGAGGAARREISKPVPVKKYTKAVSTVERIAKRGGVAKSVTSLAQKKTTTAGKAPIVKTVRGKKVHNCQRCDRTFTKSSHLTTHARQHTGNKPYICGWIDCDWRFYRSDELVRHFRMHTGIKPYICEKCNGVFARKDHLQLHKKIHEREESS